MTQDCRSTLTFAVGVFALLLSALAGAQQYPSQPIRIIVPFLPGGSADISARTVGMRLSDSLGQPVVVENRSGATGQVGIQAVIRSPADGYTLLATPNGAVTISGYFQKLPYDPAKDLVPVAMLTWVPIGIAVNAALPVNNLRDFIEFSKEKPGGLSYSTPGIGSHMHLAGELLKSMTGANLTAVPYRGSGPSTAAILSGEVPAGIADLAALLPLAKSERIRILTITNSTRTATAPDIPTVAESGVPGYGADAWIGMFAPAGTPPHIIARLNAEIARSLALPDVRQNLLKAGLEAAPMSSVDMGRFVLDEIKKWGKVIKDGNIKIN